MTRTLNELLDSILDEASEPRPNLVMIKRYAREIRALAAPESLQPGNVWERIGQKAGEAKKAEVDAAKLLAELVALKRMKEHRLGIALTRPQEALALQQEYERRQPVAWAAAFLLFPEPK